MSKQLGCPSIRSGERAGNSGLGAWLHARGLSAPDFGVNFQPGPVLKPIDFSRRKEAIPRSQLMLPGSVDDTCLLAPDPRNHPVVSPLFPPLLFASVVVDVIAVLSVLPISITIYSAAAATWALLTGQSGARVAEQAAFGLAMGFLVGIPLTICAGLALVISS